MKQNLSFLMILSLFLSIPNSYAQNCEPPTNMQNPILTHAACEGSGRIVLRTIHPAVDTYQKALLDTLGVTVKAWQDSDTFHSVAAGTYDIALRKVCQPGFSTHYTQRVTINDQTQPLNINNIRENYKDECGNGEIEVTSVSGRAPFEYALVNSISAANISSNMVREAQSSPVFSDLDAGTYYVRVYDNCGEFKTREFEVESYVGTKSISFVASGSTPNLFVKGCDSIELPIRLNNLNAINTNQGEKSAILALHFPQSGLKDTIDMDLLRSVRVRYSMEQLFGTPNNNPFFPENFDEWPLEIEGTYITPCGETTGSFEHAKPTLSSSSLRMSIPVSPKHGDCDSVLARMVVSLGYGIKGGEQTPYSYSYNGGQDWVEGIVEENDQIVFPLDAFANEQELDLMFRFCGSDTFSRTITMPERNDHVQTRYRVRRTTNTCFGKIGHFIETRPTGNPNPLTFHYYEVPVGVDPIDPIIKGSADAHISNALFNLEPGIYKVRLTDSINTDCIKQTEFEANLTNPLEVYDVTYQYGCDGELIITTDGRIQGGLSEGNVGGHWRGTILDTDIPTYNGVGGDGITNITIPSYVMDTLTPGNYTIKTWINNEPELDCTAVEVDFTHTYERLKLDNSKFIRACEDDTGAIIVDVEGGEGPYTYILYQDSIAESNLIASSQFENIFENLSLNETYIVSVVDNCGNASNLQLSGAELGLPLFYNVVDMPCEGEQLSLNVYDLKNVQYQWYKDDIEIAGANQATFDINSITLLDEGAYKVKMIMDECEVHSNVFNLTPGDEECGVPLSDLGLEWTVKIQGQNNTLIVWEELKESIQAYTVEHSRNGKTWNAIGKVVSQEKKDVHELLHQNLSAGTHFYRIAMHDNETTYYSTIKQVNIGEGRHSITMWPNPTKDAIYLKGLTAQNEIVISNVLGQELIKQSNLVEEHRVDISEFASGIYYINIYEQGLLIQSFKVVKQ